MNKVLKRDANGEPVPIFCPGTTLKISPAAGSAATSAVINATDEQIVRIAATAAVNIAMGATAAVTDMYLPNGVVEYYIVPANTKVAAYGTADVYITLHTN